MINVLKTSGCVLHAIYPTKQAHRKCFDVFIVVEVIAKNYVYIFIHGKKKVCTTKNEISHMFLPRNFQEIIIKLTPSRNFAIHLVVV